MKSVSLFAILGIGAATQIVDLSSAAADTEEASVLEGQSCGSFWTNCHGCTSTGDHCGLPSGVGPAKVVCAGPRGTEDDGPTCDVYGRDPCDSACDESFQCENPDNFFSHTCEPCLACKGIHSVAFDAQDHPHTLEVKQLHDTQIFGFKCEPGWEGENCNNDTDDCKHHDCSGHGTCTDTGTQSHTCTCHADFTGIDCFEVKPKCADFPQPVCSVMSSSVYGDTAVQCSMLEADNTGCDGWGFGLGFGQGSCTAGACVESPTCVNFPQPVCSVMSANVYGDTAAQCSIFEADSTDCNHGTGSCTAGACVQKPTCVDFPQPVCSVMSANVYGDTAAQCSMFEADNTGCDGWGFGLGFGQGSCIAGACVATPTCENFPQPVCSVMSANVYGDTAAQCSMFAADSTDCDGGQGSCTAGACVPKPPKCSTYVWGGNWGDYHNSKNHYGCLIKDDSKLDSDGASAVECGKPADDEKSCKNDEHECNHHGECVYIV